MSNVRVRIAPSPTGFLHFGTARTALFNWLYARGQAGQFIVRIEDTDRERSTSAYEQDILEGLRWLELTWDEGPDISGPHAPYRQSERITSYTEALHTLEERKAIYRCWCTEEELAREREEAAMLKKPHRYSRRCRGKTVGQGSDRFVLRFATPLEGATTWEDIIHGTVIIANDTLDDFIIAKGFEEPLYNFAVVVDDAAMDITHVIRGEDHLSNTPKQILMATALGYPIPAFAHIPLILNPDRTKMSKRLNEVRLGWYREQGYLPEALVNFIALLGWNPGTPQELFSREQLIQVFDFGRVQKAGAVFSLEKLQWMNGQYIKQLSEQEYCAQARAHCARFLPTLLPSLLPGVNEDAVLLMAKDRLRFWQELVTLLEPFTKEHLSYDLSMLRWPKVGPSWSKEECAIILEKLVGSIEHIPESDWTILGLEQRLKMWIKETGQGTGEVLWPMRVAFSSAERSPSPFELAHAYGRRWTIERLKDAREALIKAA